MKIKIYGEGIGSVVGVVVRRVIAFEGRGSGSGEGFAAVVRWWRAGRLAWWYGGIVGSIKMRVVYVADFYGESGRRLMGQVAVGQGMGRCDRGDYSNQSRGGLPRFFSPTLPSSKVSSTSAKRLTLVGFVSGHFLVNFYLLRNRNAIPGGVVRVQGDEFWHMTKVLRLTVNDSVCLLKYNARIELFNGKGCLVEGSIEKVDRTGLDFVAVRDSIVVHPHEPQWDVFAAFGTLKGGRADWLVEKCTELGASSITPLLTERSSLISENRVDRLQRVILAATKQCKPHGQRLHEMTLNPPMKIHNILPLVARSKLSFVAAAEATPIFSTLGSSNIEARGTLIIGPEGDFTEEELKMIKEAGATAVGLGPHRLRLGDLIETIKSKVNALKKNKKKKFSSNKPYVKMDKSASVKVEIRSRKARQLIDKTLKSADRPGKLTV
ncbi:hypothetical protein KSS87_004705 [Heliosperma pusillum]|nr:hypothetical protein KSS87_004705 [Heliosperma pusillum]